MLLASLGKAARAPWISSLRRYLSPILLMRGELSDLLDRATGTGAGHHEDGVQLVGLLDVLDHRLADDVSGLVPLIGDRLVALLFGDEALVVMIVVLG